MYHNVYTMRKFFMCQDLPAHDLDSVGFYVVASVKVAFKSAVWQFLVLPHGKGNYIAILIRHSHDGFLSGSLICDRCPSWQDTKP